MDGHRGLSIQWFHTSRDVTVTCLSAKCDIAHGNPPSITRPFPMCDTESIVHWSCRVGSGQVHGIIGLGLGLIHYTGSLTTIKFAWKFSLSLSTD